MGGCAGLVVERLRLKREDARTEREGASDARGSSGNAGRGDLRVLHDVLLVSGFSRVSRAAEQMLYTSTPSSLSEYWDFAVRRKENVNECELTGR